MTFSLAARCPRTGAFGMVISSSSPAVAARCVHLRPGVGAAASQNITDPRLGDRVLDVLASGSTAAEAIASVVGNDRSADYRQLTAVDAAGNTATYSGAHTLGIHHIACGGGAAAAGNLLRSPGVVDALLEGYRRSPNEDLAHRLLDGLQAALEAGGEAGPLRAAGIKVLHPNAGWASTDLRVDWHDDPVGELQRLWQVWLPQREDYITRGIDPSRAPGFDVASDR